MKRILVLMLAALMALAFAACSKPQSGTETTPPPSGGDQQGSGNNEGGAEKTENAGANIDLVLDGSRLGVLQPVNEGKAKVNGLVIDTGSGHHEYPSVEELLAAGFKTEGLCSEFFLNEWFEVYGDVEGNINAYVLPNDPALDLAKAKDAELAAIHEGLNYPVFGGPAAPDPENNGMCLNAYVHNEIASGAGLYNVIFTDGETVIGVVQLNIVPEPQA